jgi:DNA repair exonuclease SbcCD ATPase subunit
MKILSLTSENIKRLKAVEIAPGGSHVAVVGRNEQGKSSILDSIMYALAGKGTVCERPIRDGESAAKIVVSLDDYTITRTFTAAGGGTLKVEAKDGKVTSPQAVLDGLVGALTFDPLEFTRKKPAEQAEVLRKLVGIDCTAIDEQEKGAYTARTETNRLLQITNSKIGTGTINPALPETEIDAKDIIAARAEAHSRNEAKRKARVDYNSIILMIAQTDKEIGEATAIVQSLERQLEAAKQKRHLLGHQRESLVSQRQAFILPDEDENLAVFDKQILDAQQTNFSIRANNELRRLLGDRATLQQNSVNLTNRLEDLSKEREKLIAEAKYPIQGLGFSSTGAVTFNGVPFEQISTAQRLKISAAIGIALNPKLRVMLIRDGSVMDDETLAELIKVAETHDTQLWIERVGKTLEGELPGVIIEDGSVVASTLPQIPEATHSENTACV